MKLTKSQKRTMMKSSLLLDLSMQLAKMYLDNQHNPFACIYEGSLIRFKILEIESTPSNLFRHDKPKLDKRRVKRNNKGCKLLKGFHKFNKGIEFERKFIERI